MSAIAPALTIKQASADRFRTAGFFVVITGSALLMARPLLYRWHLDPIPVLVALFVGLGVVGWRWPLSDAADPSSVGSVPAAAAQPVALIGLVAFAAGRLVGGGHPLLATTTGGIALNTLAAVAEEAFFRRLLFGLLVPLGTVAAVAGSAVVFALIHVTVYGWWVVPLDVAAGLILGWQRAATGSWRVPALTHAAANLLVVL